MKRILLFALYIGFSGLGAQESNFHGNFITAGASYLELKDELNHGFVFKGPDADITFGLNRIGPEHYFSYSLSIAGGGKTAAETWGFRWFFSPLDMQYSWNIARSNKWSLYLGPRVFVGYDVQNYPEMHAGPIIWLTNYNLGFNLSAFTHIWGNPTRLELKNSVFSATSRPDIGRDPYYFTTDVGENFSDMHQNMVWGSLDKFESTEMSITMQLNNGKRPARSISYVFNYLRYRNPPELQQLFHAIRFTWHLNSSIER